MKTKKKNVCVVVLGDIGRSPRMQYHSLSLAKQGHVVDVIGYGETEPMSQIKLNPSIYCHYMCPVPYIPIKLINLVFKTIFQALNLLFLLFIARKPEVVVVQNPPAIPTLLVCWLFCKIIGARLIIDWHNYAYTILALNLSPNNILVKITKKCEAFFGARADSNFCVTKAMQKDLLKNWNIQAITLYDKPSEIYKPISLKEKHEFLLHLGKLYPEITNSDGSTIFTETSGDEILLKKSRPGLIGSSTSWTEDEDFSVLFSTLQDYESHHEQGNTRKLPDLICFITGKGHLKDYYLKMINDADWKHVKIITPWLEITDYSLLLASADLGISLHASSSGLDLPMKVVDMFGSCLPVLAYDFPCLNELVVDGENGFCFSSSKDLTNKLFMWFDNFPSNKDQNLLDGKLRANLEEYQRVRWNDYWLKHAYPVFQ